MTIYDINGNIRSEVRGDLKNPLLKIKKEKELITMQYTYIYKENFNEDTYAAFYNFFDKKVDEVLKRLSNYNPKKEFLELEYGYEGWLDVTFDEAIEATRYSIECEELQTELIEDLESAFILLEDEIKYHNERAIESQ